VDGGSFGLKLQNSPKLPHMLDSIVMQMSKGNREKGYSFHFSYPSASKRVFWTFGAGKK